MASEYGNVQTASTATGSPKAGIPAAEASDVGNNATKDGNRGGLIQSGNRIDNNKVSHGFRTQVQQTTTQHHQHRTHRKRKRDAPGDTTTPDQSMKLSSSSSSSSDEDEETKQHSSSTAPSQNHMQHHRQVDRQQPQQRHQRMPQSAGKQKDRKDGMGGGGGIEPAGRGPIEGSSQHGTQQPEGWRVKLYRLNADGSWDDCGTGRILCLYKQPAKGESSLSTTNSNLSGDAWIYQELGEPTLCMHSEVSSQGSAAGPRILLRTRILLRDAYQRQGDNIITWCEPYLEEGNPTQGVDLALSFQDNAGCLDIWRQITQVQSRAADLYRRTSGGDRSGGTANNVNANNNSLNASGNSNTKGGEGANGDIDNGAASNNDSNIGNTCNNVNPNAGGSSVVDVAHAAAAAHHANLQRQQQQEMWVNVASEAAQHHLEHQNSVVDRHRQEHDFEDAVGMVAAYHESNAAQVAAAYTPASPQLPNPPTLSNLEEIADTIAAVQHIQQREALAMYISQNECSYLKSLLSLFPSAEARGDYGSLATLAACVKTILLLNDPAIIELIVTDELIFEEVCSTLEYDPDLRDKANHRWFLRERAKFRTVALMEDEELVAAIHRAFRVNYLRDTLLRPTMDESSLSTLSSLQTFTHADVVKGVTMSPGGPDASKGEILKDSYLVRVIRMLGRELHALTKIEWEELEVLAPDAAIESIRAQRTGDPPVEEQSTIVSSGKYPQSQKMSTTWKQHLAPQDGSVASRRLRRRGCLSFLRELFNMVRTSLQQSDKDDFFAVLVSMEVNLGDGEDERKVDESQSSKDIESVETESNASETFDKKIAETQGTANSMYPTSHVNLLSLLGTVLSDPNTDVTEKGAVLEIVAGIAMHDPGLIRRRCLAFYSSWKGGRRLAERDRDRPMPNERRQTLFQCQPEDLLASLLFLLAIETDAGVLLQVTEIMRIILDTDMMGEHGPMGSGFTDEAEVPAGGPHSSSHEQHNVAPGSGTTTDQNQFLSMFYDHYVQWLAAPFQFIIFHPIRRVPNPVSNASSESTLVRTMLEVFDKGEAEANPFLRKVPICALRSSFAVELLSFCVRAHLYRMKCYLLRSRVLSSVLSLLKPTAVARRTSGDRCLKLAVLRLLRAILSVNDEFYHRHIIQQNLFGPVFEAFRENPVGDNLVSSAIVEMCDFIHSDNIKSLIEYIVTKHLSASEVEGAKPSLEAVSSPYVSTLTELRKAYEKNLKAANKTGPVDTQEAQGQDGASHSRYFHGATPARGARIVMNEKALEDQRKFREADKEESYFDSDDVETSSAPSPNTVVPPAVDEVAAQEGENELHRTPRMFSLTQAPLLSNGSLRVEQPSPSSGGGAGVDD